DSSASSSRAPSAMATCGNTALRTLRPDGAGSGSKCVCPTVSHGSSAAGTSPSGKRVSSSPTGANMPPRFDYKGPPYPNYYPVTPPKRPFRIHPVRIETYPLPFVVFFTEAVETGERIGGPYPNI